MKLPLQLHRYCFLVLFVLISPALKANEGMWLLALLKKYNAEELHKMGLKIPIEKISGGAGEVLSEAVVRFGSGCTGSVISEQGLILTNYHCSYGAIQQHASALNNISENGFWAVNNKAELPIAGLKITITKKIVEVSDEILSQFNNPSKSIVPLPIILKQITEKYQRQYPDCKIILKTYRNNTIFALYVQQDYHDVRLVGLAPKNIAKFGGETDNWTWPRYSADFAFFRVYTNAFGKPANYATSNIPMKAASFLKLSTAGYKAGDFAMSIGFPSMSERQATSYKIENKKYAQNPPTIAVRKLRLSILEAEMAKDDQVKRAYAEKYATSANYYKNAVGMNDWIDRLGIIGKKKREENVWLNELLIGKDTSFSLQKAFSQLDATSAESITGNRALMYYTESFSEACDMINFISAFSWGFKRYEQELKKNPSHRTNYLANISSYYKTSNPAVDKRLTKEVLSMLKDSLPAAFLPDIYEKEKLYTKEAINNYVDAVFENSVFADSLLLQKWMAQTNRKSLENDPSILLVESINRKQQEIGNATRALNNQRGRTYNAYAESRNTYETGSYYPDADNTMRLSYGKVSELNNGTELLSYQTMLSDLMKKSGSTNKDYYINPLLNGMWQKKKFGTFALTEDMPTCFITDGDVTGGNSGSPMLDANGNVIGLVFDCNWESMTREFNFDASLHRVICVDIRYILYLTEQLSNNKNLLNELLGAR